jgi:hypothetical protein
MIDMNRIKKGMRVISSDDCCMGVVADAADKGVLKVLSIAAGSGYDCEIPASWVAEVAECIYLDKSGAFIAANRHNCLPASQRQPARIAASR